MIELVGFDGDDTLWHSEGYFQAAHAEFERIIGRYVDLADARVHERLLEIEREQPAAVRLRRQGHDPVDDRAAIALTGGAHLARRPAPLLRLGKDVLHHPVELLDGHPRSGRRGRARFRIVLITKGDLFHQEAKVAQSGLADLFQRIEIVSEKNARTYRARPARVRGRAGALSR